MSQLPLTRWSKTKDYPSLVKLFLTAPPPIAIFINAANVITTTCNEPRLLNSRYRDILREKLGECGGVLVPIIARFFGIVIRMYFLQSEHNPPHIHAIYGDNAAAFAISTGEMIDGSIPSKERGLITEWINDNRNDLIAMWESQEFKKLPPLN